MAYGLAGSIMRSYGQSLLVYASRLPQLFLVKEGKGFLLLWFKPNDLFGERY